MNKAYKVIYNETTGTYVAVSELETSHGKATQSIKTSTFIPLNALGSIKRLDFNKFTLATLGIFTALAMPMAHASWVNSVSNGSNLVEYGATNDTGSIAIGSDESAGKAYASGKQSTALGYNATTTNDGGTAVGAHSLTKGVNATAIGYNANTDGASSLALGADTTVFGDRGIAIGNKAQAMNSKAMAIGTDAQALGTYSIAIGDRNQSMQQESIAIGLQNKVNGEKASTFGHRNIVDNYHGLAVGHDSVVDGDASVSVGSESLVAGANSMSFGNDNWITGDGTVVSGYNNKVGTSTYDEPTLTYKLGKAYNSVSIVGQNNTALSNNVSIIGLNNTINTDLDNTVILGNNVNVASTANSTKLANGGIFNGSVALGSNTTIDAPIATQSYTIGGKNHNFAGTQPVGTVSIGAQGKERTITNLAAGRISGSSTDAINGSQLYALVEQANASGIHFVSINSKDASKANYGNDGAKGIDGIAIGVAANSLGNYAVAMGLNANASGEDNIALGRNSLTNSHSAIAIGAESSADFYSTAIGQRAKADTQAVALGSISKAADNAVAIGHQANAAKGAASIGSWAEANGLNSIALGTNAEAHKEAGIAIGGQSNAYANRSTAIGMLANATGDYAITLGDGSNASGLRSTALGPYANASGERSTAIGNNSQAAGLYSTSVGLQSYATGDRSTSLGALSNATGLRSIALGTSALTSADYSVALGNQAKSSVANSVAIGSFATTAAANATNITGTAGQNAKGVVSVGSTGYERQIQNVAAGRVDATSTDAINGSQLYALTSMANASPLHYLSVNDNGTQGSNHDNKGAAGKNSIAIGVNTSTATTAENAVALGFKAQANGTDTIAIGTQAKAIGNTSNTIVIGNTSTSTDNKGSLTFGNGNTATNNTEIVQIGSGNSADTSIAVAAIGGLNRTSGSFTSSIIGINNSLTASANSSIMGINNNIAASTAINVSGVNNNITSSINNSIIGNNNTLTSGSNNIIAGFDNTLGTGLKQTQILGSNITVDPNVAYGIAVGSGSKITKNNAVTLGANAIASETGSVAIGANSVANIASGIAGYIPTGASQAQINAINNTKSTSGAVSVGDVQNKVFRQITGVAAGTADSDAVNVAQLKAISASIPADLHYFSVNSTGGGNFLNDGASGIDAIAIGKDTVASGANSYASGKGSKALGTNSYASGTLSTATGGQAIAVGNGAFADGAGNTSDSGAIAIGANAYARAQGGGNTAIALGSNAFAEHSSIAMGHNAQATKLGSIALGYQANTTDSDSGIAIGDRALTSGKNAIAIGGNAYTGNTSAQGDGALAVGSGATSNGWGAVALGGLSGSNGGSQANEDFAVAIGSAAHALASGAVAIGGTNNSKANASGIDSLAIGAGSQTQTGTQNAMAIGTDAKALADNTLSLGSNSSTTQAGGVALGSNSVSSTAAGIVGYIPNGSSALASNAIKATTSTLAAVSVGNAAQNQFRQITGLAAGTADSDAVNVAQLKAISANTSSVHFLSVQNPGSTFANYNNDGASGAGSIAIGVDTTVAGNESIAIGKGINVVATSNNNLIIGNSASANSHDATVLGYKANAQGTGTVAIGSGANTIGSGQSVAIGAASESSVNSVALGYMADATAKQSVAVGSSSKALAQQAVAMGMQANAYQAGAIAIGQGTKAQYTDSIALGRGSVTNQANSIALGAYSNTKATVATAGTTIAGVNYVFKGITPNGAVSLGSDGKERQVQNVAAGQINQNSTDAINGSQLYAAYNAIDVAYATGLNFAGNTGTDVHRTLGQTLSIVGAAVNPVNTLTYDTASVATASDYSAKNVQTVTDKNGNMQIQFAERPVFDGVTLGDAANNLVTINEGGININKGSKNIVISGDTVSFGGNVINNIAAGVSLTDAVNVGQLKDLGTSLTDAGLNFKDSAGNVNHSKLGDTLSIVGAAVNPVNTLTYDTASVATASDYSAKNVQTVTDKNGNMQIQFAERPVFDGVTLGDAANNLVTINEGGININKGSKNIVISGDTVSFGGNVINNIAAGVSLTDAVNVGQLKDLGTSLTDAGLNFKDSAGNVNHSKLGDTLSIVGAAVNPVNTVTYDTASIATASDYSAKNVQTVTDKNGNMQIQFAERPVFDGVTLGDAANNLVTINEGGININKGSKNIVISGDTVSFGGNVINNIAAGISLTDAVNVGQLKDLGTSLTDAGLNFKDSAGNVNHSKLGDTLSIVGAAVNPVNTVTYDATSVATASDYSAKNVQTVTDKNGNMQIQFAERPVFDGVTLGDAANNLVTINEGGININKGSKNIVISGDNINFGGNTLAGVNPGAVNNTSTDAVNGSQLYAVQNIASLGWNIQTNGDTASQVQPGATVDIGTATGENNIKVSRNGNVIDFELNKNLDLGSTGSIVMGPTTINQDGLTIVGGPSVTIKGIDAGSKTITNVAPGKNGTDGVNVNQLKDLGTSLTDAGLNFKDSAGNVNHSKLGDTLSIVGAAVNPVNTLTYDTASVATASDYSAKNVQTVTDKNGNMQIQFAERPVFDGVTLGDAANNLVTINEGGININKGSKNIVISGDNINFGGNTLAGVNPGAVNNTSTDAVNGSQLYAVQNIASLGWNIQTNGDTASQVQPGATVDIGTASGENNIKVSRNGNVIDFELNKNLDLGSTGSITMGPTTINQDGLTILGGPSVTINGIDAGNKTITSVAPGKNGTDAVNVDQLDAVKNTAGMGWNIQTNGDTATQVKPGDAVDIGTATGETNIKVSRNGNTVDFELNKNLDLGNTGSITLGDSYLNNDGLTINNGPSITKNGIDAGNKTITNVAAGTGLTDAVNLGQLNQAIAGSKYAGLKVENGSDIITANESLNIVGQDGTTVVYDKNSNTYTVSSKNGGTGTGGMNDWNVTGSDGKGGSVSVPITDGKSVDFAAGSKNVVVTPTQSADGAKVTVDVAQDLNLSSVTTKNADGSSTVVNGNGVTIKGKDGKNGASITQAGIDAGNQKLTNIAAGTEATDAVNVSQLNAVSGSINNLSNRINEVEDNANAGTATAIAIANLPQAYEPGARVFSVAAGTYEGETGYAVGYSAISDGGNWIIKASGTANSQQKFGAGAGVGYRWR